MEIFTFFGVIALLIWVANLSGRVARLEGRGKLIDTTPVEDVASPQSPAGILTAKIPVENWSNKFVDWLKEDWLMKLGALLLLIGFGWFATYAFLNNWIGPFGRIALGIIAGSLILALGWWRIQKYLHQGGVFIVLGSTTILLTIFAAREIYNFFTPMSALAVMFLSTAFVAYASVKYNSRSLSLSSLVLAGLAPLLTNSPATDYIGLFSYLLVVILGAVWIVKITGQRELTAAALILVSFYSAPHLIGFTSSDKGLLLIFAYAFAAVFFLTNSFGLLKLQGKDILPDLYIAVFNGLFLLAWITGAAEDEWKSLIIVSWMTVFSVGAFMIMKITGRREPFYIYSCVGIAMLAAATAAELDGAALTIAFTIESAVIAYLAYYFLHDARIALRTCLLLIGPMLMSLGSLSSYSWRIRVFNEDFFVLLTVSAAVSSLGYFFYLRSRADGAAGEVRQFSSALMVLGSIWAYILLWLSLHSAIPKNNDAATMICLIIYTLIGLSAYYIGVMRDGKVLKLYGGIMLGFVVGRMLLVEVWNMELTGKIITFFAIGTLLTGTAFLGRKKKASVNTENFTI